MCNGQLQKKNKHILAKALDNSRKCHHMFLYLYPCSHGVWALLLPRSLETTLFLILTKNSRIWWWTYVTSIDVSHPSHFALTLCWMLEFQLGLQMQLNISFLLVNIMAFSNVLFMVMNT